MPPQDILPLRRVQHVELRHGGVLVTVGGGAAGHVEGGCAGDDGKEVGEEEKIQGRNSIALIVSTSFC